MYISFFLKVFHLCNGKVENKGCKQIYRQNVQKRILRVSMEFNVPILVRTYHFKLVYFTFKVVLIIKDWCMNSYRVLQNLKN